MRTFTKIAFVAGAGLASVGMAPGAWAYFTATGTATTSAKVAAVAPPTGVTATETTPGTVHVQWTRPAAPGGLPLTGFFVERLVGPAALPACGSSPATPLAATTSTCDDPGIAPGPYDYRVTAVFRTFTAPSALAPVTVTGTPL
ncbi:MAG: fibronectin type III domain-containing protein [Actinobacteria bacterium]|nr:fibronectin type III domain-containing protein [Actinomycetota bacterium]